MAFPTTSAMLRAIKRGRRGGRRERFATRASEKTLLTDLLPSSGRFSTLRKQRSAALFSEIERDNDRNYERALEITTLCNHIEVPLRQSICGAEKVYVSFIYV